MDKEPCHACHDAKSHASAPVWNPKRKLSVRLKQQSNVRDSMSGYIATGKNTIDSNTMSSIEAYQGKSKI